MNNIDGSFYINDQLIQPFLTKKTFLMDSGDNLRDKNEANNVFRFKKPIELNGLYFYASFIFVDGLLRGVNLNNSDEKLENSYANWSNDKVRLKRESHDLWVKNQFGEPYEKTEVALEVKRVWGEVTSYTDMKGGNVGISIIYK